MTICELYISEKEPHMFEKAFLLIGEERTELAFFVNTGFVQDSIIVGIPTKMGDILEDVVRYYPHGKRNEEGNKIIVYSSSSDELIIHNQTDSVLFVNKDYAIFSKQSMQI